jgi:hypothetical protein
MTQKVYLDDDFDEEEPDISPGLHAQLERIEQNQNFKFDKQHRLRQEKLRVRRQIEERAELRRMRDEVDYLE